MGMSFLSFDGKILCLDCKSEHIKNLMRLKQLKIDLL
jgi:ribosomal protein L44E